MASRKHGHYNILCLNRPKPERGIETKSDPWVALIDSSLNRPKPERGIETIHCSVLAGLSPASE